MNKNDLDAVQKLMARNSEIKKYYTHQLKNKQKQIDYYESLFIIKIYKLIKRIIRR